MTNENCKYVARLPDGSYIIKIEDDKVLTCKSRLRARQFNLAECQILARNLKVQLIEADWQQVQ
jgi:hypothetical protein